DQAGEHDGAIGEGDGRGLIGDRDSLQDLCEGDFDARNPTTVVEGKEPISGRHDMHCGHHLWSTRGPCGYSDTHSAPGSIRSRDGDTHAVLSWPVVACPGPSVRIGADTLRDSH